MSREPFDAELAVVLHAQADLVRRLGASVSEAERALEDTAAQRRDIAELEQAMSELEAADGLTAEDLATFDPGEVTAIYARRHAALALELSALPGKGDWPHLVRWARAEGAVHGLDPLAPYEALLTPDDLATLRREDYAAQYRWDRWDYAFTGAAGVLAALTDFLLVRIPQTMGASSVFRGQTGSPLTAWLKGYDTTDTTRSDWFTRLARELEARCKVPYDASQIEVGGELVRIAGMSPRTHRLQSLGHDPVLGFVFGVLDIMRGTLTGFSYDRLKQSHAPFSGPVQVNVDPVHLVEALLKHIGHLVSDVATPMGLPAPLMGLFQALNVGSFGSGKRTIAELARWMYLNGYDLRHFIASGVTPAVIEIVLRGYVLIRHYAEHGEAKVMLANHPKYRSMLLAAHSVAAVANAGKVCLYSGNPLAINQAEWMALFRYLVPSMKYWLFDRERLRLQHIERINDAGWRELEERSGRLIRLVAEEQLPVFTLGQHPRTYHQPSERGPP